MDNLEELYSLGGNTFYAVAYAILLPPQIYLGIKYKTWGFLFAMLCGLVLEVIGYAARIRMSQGENQFVMYIICITIGPAFFSAAIYLCFARIVRVYGQHLWRVSPRFITITFMVADICALLLQIAGGGSASHSDPDTRQASLKTLQAGLAVHLIGIFAFVLLSGAFAYLVRSNRGRWDPRLEPLQKSTRFKAFLIALAVATVLILIRTAFRVAELSQGYKSDISRNEDLFFVLEGAVVLVATICLTGGHPGIGFQYLWQEADFQLKSPRKRGARRDVAGTVDSA